MTITPPQKNLVEVTYLFIIGHVYAAREKRKVRVGLSFLELRRGRRGGHRLGHLHELLDHGASADTREGGDGDNDGSSEVNGLGHAFLS